MTAKLAEQLKDFPLYSQDGKQKDATCVCVSVCLKLNSSAGMYWRGNQKATT